MEQLNAFIKKAQSDPELMEKLNCLGASDEKTEEIITLAAQYGFTITQEDIGNVKNRCKNCNGCSELSEEELDAVAGGGATQNRWNPDECRKYNHPHYWCVGFLKLCWCDHYTYKVSYGTHANTYYHKCSMGRFEYETTEDFNPDIL